MYSFESEDWTAPIHAVSTQPRFQKSKIRIEDHSLIVPGEYDVDTGTYTEPTGDPVVYEGQARLIGIRWGTFTGGESQANATTLSAIRVQIPNARFDEGYGEDDYGDDYAGGLSGRVKRGCKIFVLDSPNNPALNGLILTITSDLQGSSAAARTFEASLDADTTVVASGVPRNG